MRFEIPSGFRLRFVAVRRSVGVELWGSGALSASIGDILEVENERISEELG